MSKHAKADEPPDRGDYTARDQRELAEELAEEYLAGEWQAGHATGPLQAFVAGYEAAKAVDDAAPAAPEGGAV